MLVLVLVLMLVLVLVLVLRLTLQWSVDRNGNLLHRCRLREAGLETLLLRQGGRRQARVGGTEEVASVHVEGWDLSCRTCCRLRDVHLWGLLLLGQEGRHTAQLREAAATTATAGGGQTPTLQLLGLHLTDVRGVRGRGGLGAEG